MAPPVTECAYVTLKAGTDLEDPESATAKTWHTTLNTVSSQPGFQRAVWGKQLENPNIVILLVDWDTLQDHQNFIDAPIYEPFTKRVMAVLNNLYMDHFTPSTWPPKLFTDVPVVEFATFFGTEPIFLPNVKKFAGALEEEKPEGYLGSVYAEVIEDIAKGGVEEGKGRAVRLCIGWTSKEAHMKYRETGHFKENVKLLRQGFEGNEMVHVSFKIHQTT